MNAVGSLLARAQPPATRGTTSLVPARAALADAVERAASHGRRYGWPFAIVVVQLCGTTPESVEPVVESMAARLRTGDELHRYREDAVALILPAMPADSVPAMLGRITARVTALHFGIANSPLEGSDAVTLLSLAEHRLADAATRA
jgi:hypothetical protein